MDMQSRLEEAAAHLQTAITQSIPTDDQIIMNHVRDALIEVRAVLADIMRMQQGPGMTATEVRARIEEYGTLSRSQQF